MSKIVLDVFRGSSPHYHDPQTLLSEFQYAFSTLHLRIKEAAYARGCRLAKLTAADWTDKKKVGITIDSLINAIYIDLVPVPADALAAAMFKVAATHAPVALDRCTICYLEGYRDATNAIIARILSGTDIPAQAPSADRPSRKKRGNRVVRSKPRK